MKIRFLIITLLLPVSGLAHAGEQYVDKTGFAISGYDPVAYFSLKQKSIGEAQPMAVAGSADITAEHNGATWAFSSEENRKAFLADPEKYTPAYDGHCAYGVGQGGKVPANPNLWRIIDGQLYLNINKRVVGFWEEDIAGNLNKAENNWSGIEPKSSSKNPVPDFDTANAPQ